VVDTSDITGTPVSIAATWEDVLWIADDAGALWVQDSTTLAFSQVSSTDVIGTVWDVSVGLDGSVWVATTAVKDDTTSIGQWVVSAEKLVSFGGSGDTISAFDFMYATSVDMSSSKSNKN